MPHEEMTDQQVAAYLSMDVREVAKLASRGKIPCRKVGGKFRFLKGEVDHWVETRMHTLDKSQLSGIQKGVSAHHGLDPHGPIIMPLIPRRGLAVPLRAKTRDAVLRDLVDIADKAELVYNRDDLINEIRTREDLCSTAMLPGVAMPHPRHSVPYDIADSFIVVGLTASGVPFGAEDGSLTRLFFLICSKDERTHLHILARLAAMMHDQSVIDWMLQAENAEELAEILEKTEQNIIDRLAN